jgi:DDE superfamily endonuclease
MFEADDCLLGECHGLPIELLVAVVVAADYAEGQPRKKRARNEKRDRQRAIDDIMRWSEPLFRRAFRIGRADFVALRESCKEHHRQRNKGMAELSSGSMVQLETKMFVTLRTLAGAAYIDLLWYGLPINHIPTYVKETVSIFNKCSLLDTIRLPRTEDEVNMIRAGWVRIAMRKFGVDLMDGHTLLAGDGLIVAIRCPNTKDVERYGIPSDRYFNRKGYHALNMQAFCDAYAMFRFIDIRFPGSVNDLTAFKMTDLYQAFSNPDHDLYTMYDDRELALVLDEAYSSLGERFLTPYSKAQLDTLRREGPDTYNSALLFCNRLSGQRITEERAFGMLVRRFGILWRPIEYSVFNARKIVEACCRLHNLCMQRWKTDHNVDDLDKNFVRRRREEVAAEEGINLNEALAANEAMVHVLDVDLFSGDRVAVPHPRRAPVGERRDRRQRRAERDVMPDQDGFDLVRREMINEFGINDPLDLMGPPRAKACALRERLRLRMMELGFRFEGVDVLGGDDEEFILQE